MMSKKEKIKSEASADQGAKSSSGKPAAAPKGKSDDLKSNPSEPAAQTTAQTTADQPPRRSKQWKILVVLGIIALPVIALLFRSDLACYRANQYLKRRRYEEAEWWLHLSQNLTADDAETEFLLARLARRRGDEGDSEQFTKHLGRAAELGFDQERIERENMLANAQSGRMAEADPHLGAMLRDQQGDGAEICEAYVMGYVRTYRLNEAVSLMSAWIKDYPYDPQPYYLRGFLWQDLYRWKEAQKDFERAVNLDGEYYEARLGLAEVLLINKQPKKAIEHFEVALAKPKTEVSAKIGLASCYRVMTKPKQARELLAEVLVQAPNNVAAIMEMARLEMSEANYNEAYSLLQPVVPRAPHNMDLRQAYATAMRGLGRATNDQAKIDEAQKELTWIKNAKIEIDGAASLARRALTDPKNIDLRFRVAQTYMEFSSPEEGLMWYLSVLQIDPQHKPTHEALAQYYGTKQPRTETDDKLAAEHRASANGAPFRQSPASNLVPSGTGSPFPIRNLPKGPSAPFSP